MREAAAALLAAVETWAKARGRAHVRGPISPSLNDTCGLLIDGFDTDSMLLMPHNPPEYAGFIESAGYRQGQGSLRVAVRHRPRRAARDDADRRAAAPEAAAHDPADQDGRVRARDRPAARAVYERVGAQLGLRGADEGRIPAHRQGDEADLRSALRGRRRGGRAARRLRRRAPRHQPGAQGHQRQAVPVRADQAA